MAKQEISEIWEYYSKQRVEDTLKIKPRGKPEDRKQDAQDTAKGEIPSRAADPDSRLREMAKYYEIPEAYR